jgi:hypothetical protein
MRARLQKMVDSVFQSEEGRGDLRRGAAALAAKLAGGVLEASESLPAPMQRWVELVAKHAWRATDEDVAALKADGFDEDAIYETTCAAAMGAAIARYQIVARAIEAARAGKREVG